MDDERVFYMPPLDNEPVLHIHIRYNVYRLVADSLFATFALFCLQLLSIVSFGCE